MEEGMTPGQIGEEPMKGDGDVLAARVAELEAELHAAREQASTLESRWRASAVSGALSLALQQAGCRDVEGALRLLDPAGVALDEAGAVTGVAEAVAALQRTRGYFFTPRTQGRQANPLTSLIPADPAAAFAAWLKGR